MRFTFIPAVALGVALLAACAAPSDQGATGPLFSRRITIDDLNQTLTTGAARLEIELQEPAASGPAIAREVEVQEADDLTDEESIEAGAVRFEGLENSATACRGSIVLGPFTVQFDGATTEFEGSDDQDLTCAQFVEQVQAAIAAGGSPVVEAERPAPAEPQAPDAAAFAAAELKLEGDDDETEIEINVDADNTLACSSLSSAPAGCLGVLKVLNVPIAVVGGVTELESEVEHDDMDDEDFEGRVTAVTREGTSCTIGTVTLDDGTVVSLIAETELEHESGDDDHLADLCAVEAALTAGSDVEADGKGLVTGDSPRTILAAEVEFEAEDEASGDDSGPH